MRPRSSIGSRMMVMNERHDSALSSVLRVDLNLNPAVHTCNNGLI